MSPQGEPWTVHAHRAKPLLEVNGAKRGGREGDEAAVAINPPQIRSRKGRWLRGEEEEEEAWVRRLEGGKRLGCKFDKGKCFENLHRDLRN